MHMAGRWHCLGLCLRHTLLGTYMWILKVPGQTNTLSMPVCGTHQWARTLWGRLGANPGELAIRIWFTTHCLPTGSEWNLWSNGSRRTTERGDDGLPAALEFDDAFVVGKRQCVCETLAVDKDWKPYHDPTQAYMKLWNNCSHTVCLYVFRWYLPKSENSQGQKFC